LCGVLRCSGSGAAAATSGATAGVPSTRNSTVSAGGGAYEYYIYIFLFFSHIRQLAPQQQSAEPRNIAGVEALAVARRPKEASREKTRPPPVSRGSSP